MCKYFIAGFGFIFFFNTALAALYTGNGDISFGGAVGLGNLSLTDNGSVVSATFTKGSGDFNSDLIIFIDSKSGGFSSTIGFTDASSRLTRAISGLDGTGNRATATFASGFSADYAIALAAHSGNQAGRLFQLVNNGSHIDLGSVGLNPTTSQSSTYTFSFSLSSLGLAPGQSFKMESTYIGDTGFRSLESFESLTGFTGWDSVAFDNADTYFTAVPEPINAALPVFALVALTAVISRGKFERWIRTSAICKTVAQYRTANTA